MYRLINDVLQPYPIVCLALGLGVVRLWWTRERDRRGPWLVTLSFAALLAISLPLASHFAVGSLDWQHPPLSDRPAEIDAIVVLGGGMSQPDADHQAALKEDSIARCLYGAELYAAGEPCTLIVCGGRVNDDDPGPPVSHLMRDFLLRLGVREPDIIVEDHSRTTYENAVEAKKLIDAQGFRRVLLVTEATHMPRSMKCFEKLGLHPTAAGFGHVDSAIELDADDLIPNPKSLVNVHRAFHEWLGMAWYWMKGRI